MNFNVLEPERNRTGTGNKFNLIMRMPVLQKPIRNNLLLNYFKATLNHRK